jgi:serine protease Do
MLRSCLILFEKTMIYRYLIPLSLTAATLIMSISQTVEAAREASAIQPKEVAAIAKKMVVRIESADGGFGSGVIIGRVKKGAKNIYTILTAAHVVNSDSNSYQLITPIILDNSGKKKREKIKIDVDRNIKILPKVDLAIFSFESNYDFAVGTIGNSEYAEEGTPVYVAGFPKPGRAIKQITFQFTGGMVSSRLEESDTNTQEPTTTNGYNLSYTSITRSGMSGGPVLDVAGRVVAIHGQGDRNSQSPEEENSGGVGSTEKTGFNLGIPMQTFLKLQPQVTKVFGAKIDKSPVNYQLSDSSATIGTNNRKFLRRYRTRSGTAPILDVTKVSEQTSD